MIKECQVLKRSLSEKYLIIKNLPGLRMIIAKRFALLIHRKASYSEAAKHQKNTLFEEFNLPSVHTVTLYAI